MGIMSRISLLGSRVWRVCELCLREDDLLYLHLFAGQLATVCSCSSYSSARPPAGLCPVRVREAPMRLWGAGGPME